MLKSSNHKLYFPSSQKNTLISTTETDCSFYLFSLGMEIYLDEDRPCVATFEGVHLSWRQKTCEWEKKTLSGAHGKLYMLLPLTEVRGLGIFIKLSFYVIDYQSH